MCERNHYVNYQYYSLSLIKISSYVCMKLSVEVRTTQVSVYFIIVQVSVSEVCKNKLHFSFT